MTPYYQDELVQLFLGDCRDVQYRGDVMITDPPYGISYSSGKTGYHGGIALPGITGDLDPSLRDFALGAWTNKPALVFGSWRVSRPRNISAMLIWDKGDHVGMGDLALPWKPNFEEIYVIGKGFSGHRGSSVLRFRAPVSWNSVKYGRSHPHEKPEALMSALIGKTTGVVLDPFCGSGSTLAAAKRLGRKSIGIEIEERYCEIAARRLYQGSLAEMFQ